MTEIPSIGQYSKWLLLTHHFRWRPHQYTRRRQDSIGKAPPRPQLYMDRSVQQREHHVITVTNVCKPCDCGGKCYWLVCSTNRLFWSFTSLTEAWPSTIYLFLVKRNGFKLTLLYYEMTWLLSEITWIHCEMTWLHGKINQNHVLTSSFDSTGIHL